MKHFPADVGIVRMSTIKFTIDGAEVEGRADETIWQIAKRYDVDIPHLCYSTAPTYRADGNCRACMVEIEGERVLAASCLRKPTEGMKVGVATPRAEASRKMVFELLVADQPERATSHDPEFEVLELGRQGRRHHQPLPRRTSGR